jgi:hypothetical protein
VIRDEVLGARQEHGAEGLGRGHLDVPRRGRVDQEAQGARQPDVAQHVRERVRAAATTEQDGRAAARRRSPGPS